MQANVITNKDIIKLNASNNINLNGSSVVTATAFTSIYVDGTAASTIPDTGWHHIAVTTNSNINADTFEIGRSTSYFNGILDDIRVYNVALSPADIADLYKIAN